MALSCDWKQKHILLNIVVKPLLCPIPRAPKNHSMPWKTYQISYKNYMRPSFTTWVGTVGAPHTPNRSLAHHPSLHLLLPRKNITTRQDSASYKMFFSTSREDGRVAPLKTVSLRWMLLVNYKLYRIISWCLSLYLPFQVYFGEPPIPTT